MQVFSRTDIFKQSAFVDNQIAREQQATFRTINQDDPDEVAYMIPFLDHLQAFLPDDNPVVDFCVLAYPAETKQDYENNFPGVMVDFFAKLKIEELYFLTVCKNDWNDFIFENDEKQRAFLALIDGRTDGVGFLVAVKNLPAVLPLFFFKHPDHPHINFISPAGDVSIDMFLCKDGNFHTLFYEKYDGQLKAAAEESGLYMGSYEACHLHRNSQLKVVSSHE